MSSITLPSQHPLRVALHNEIHARPPEALGTPLAISHTVLVCDAAQREASRAHLMDLLRDHHLPLPDAQATHFRMEFGAFRLRWELHTEFVSWTFIRSLAQFPAADREPESALQVVPEAWFAKLPGQLLSGLHLWAYARSDRSSALVRRMLNEDALVASSVAGNAAEVYTDFAIHADGFSRILLFTQAMSAGGLDRAPQDADAPYMTPRRLGRLVQRLLEIETYRMAALLGLPVAREASSLLGAAERELAGLAGSIRTANREDEPLLLDRLTRLAGQVESHYAATHSRFSASSAYFELVDRRIAEIIEQRLPGLQTIREFMDRRLSPARNTCEWVMRRQDSLSQRVSRISNLLRTRVEIEQQESSQALLATMNQRQDMQLKLQATVEGLSVAAITYYFIGLISYVAKGANKLGWPLSSELTSALAVPIVAALVWWSLRRLHRKIVGHH